jgi:hypothetical protein
MHKYFTLSHSKSIVIFIILVIIFAILLAFNFFLKSSQPIHLVFISIVSLYALLVFLFFYTFVYPKKNLPFIVILLLLSILPLVSILRPGPFESGDFSIHTQIAMGFDKSLREGNILPRWNDNACGRYGCPDFIFLFILPYYLISAIHFVGFPFITSLKIFLILSFITSGFSMYLWLKDSFGQKSALVGAIFYLYAPYHFVNMYFRTDVGETLSFAIYPLLFLFIKRLVDTKKIMYSVLFAIFATLLLLSHTTMFYSAIPLTSIYFSILWLQKKQRNIRVFLQLLLSLVLTFLLSTFYWLPLLYQSKLVSYGSTSHILLHSVQELLYSPWRYGFLFQGTHGELSYLIGYMQLFFIILSIFIVIKYRKNVNLLLYGYFIVSFLILSFLVLNISRDIWITVPFMDKFENSHRLILPITIFISGIVGLTSRYIKINYILTIFSFLAIATTILNWGNRGTLPSVTDNQLRNEYRQDSLGHQTLSPLWVDVKSDWSLKKPSHDLEILQGQANIKEIKRTTNVHTYSVNAKNNLMLKENTFYFPGWVVEQDGKKIPFTYQDKHYSGIMIFHVPQGMHQIVVEYFTVFIQKIANCISLLTFTIMLIYIIVYMQSRKRNV